MHEKRGFGKLRRWASVPRRVCGMLDVRDADTAKVADTVWTMPNFQHTSRWMEPSGSKNTDLMRAQGGYLYVSKKE